MLECQRWLKIRAEAELKVGRLTKENKKDIMLEVTEELKAVHGLVRQAMKEKEA